ncbi:hypothetical protein F4678DRAFT_457154 [Xylaria arbuscula]|nr:hypothetical protein F4678DRAFT_457154 [Xylaria arbuscula]
MAGLDFSHPVNPNDPGLGPTTKALTWLFTGFAIIVVATRFYLRRKFVKFWALDDWIMLAALVLQIVYSALITKACDEGLGMTYVNLTLEKYKGLFMWTFIALPFTHAVSVLARVSITLMLIKIFGKSKPWFKLFLATYTSIQAIFGVISIILAIADMSPIESHWDPTVTPTRQLNPTVQQAIAETLQFLYSVCDLAYTIFPIFFVWKLNMAMRTKIGLIILLGLSVVTFAAALSKAVVIALALTGHFVMTGPDFNGLYFYISTIEQCLVIIIGCVPALRTISKLQFPTFNAIGESLTTLLMRTRRSSSSNHSGRSGRSGKSWSQSQNDIEMGPHKIRLDDERYERSHFVEGQSSSRELANDGQIRRMDEFGIEYTKK